MFDSGVVTSATNAGDDTRMEAARRWIKLKERFRTPYSPDPCGSPFGPPAAFKSAVLPI